MKRFVLLGLAFSGAAACGDDSGDQPIDAARIDAPIDAADEIDAPAVTHGGSISLVEASVLNPGVSGTYFGQGVQISISFTSSANVPGPVMQDDPNSPLGCKAWEYTVAQTAALIGEDEGLVTPASTGTGAPNLPPCAFRPGVGYICPHTNTMSTGGAIGVAGTNLWTLTDADTTFSDNNSLGKYVQITGAATAANNGVFPIVQRPAASTIVFANSTPGAMAEALPVTAAHINLAGVGPIPLSAAPDPGFLGDDNTMSFALTPGGGNHFQPFTSTTGVGTVGDDFDLATAEANKLNAIPRDGSAFTITCDTAECPTGSAAGTVLNIVTTDAPTAGLSPFAMPPPVTKRVQIRCGSLGATAMTVPAAYSAYLMSSGATRIQASFIRGALLGGGPEGFSVVAGHAIVGFSNPP